MKSFLEIVSKLAMNLQTVSSEQEHDRAFVEAARIRLEGATSCEDAREGIREVVANLIGSEQMAIFEIDYSKAIMWERWCYGIDPSPQVPVDLIAHPELYRALQGDVVSFADPMRFSCFKEPVSAIAPIPPCGNPAGLLVLFGILPQKDQLTLSDRELLIVLGGVATSALSEEYSGNSKA